MNKKLLSKWNLWVVELWYIHKELVDLIESIIRTRFVNSQSHGKKIKNTKKLAYDDVI